MQDRLTEIKAREAAATPGPWEKQVQEFSYQYAPSSIKRSITINTLGQGRFNSMANLSCREGDLEFIVESRADIPYLIAEVERLRAENERLKHG